MRSKTRKTSRRCGLTGLIALGATLSVLAASVAPALATEIREYDSQMTGFVSPTAVTVGPNDEIWTSDVGRASLLQHWSSYPSQTLLGQQTGAGLWGGGIEVRGPAVSDANGFLYAPFSSCTTPTLSIYDNFNDPFSVDLLTDLGLACQTWGAVDNSEASDSYGHYYIYADGAPSSLVHAFDGYGNPVNFTGSAPYIDGNKLTGTPSGPFAAAAAGGGDDNPVFFPPRLSGITVDPTNGNIWVVATAGTTSGLGELDEFAPDGTFIQRITGSSAGVPVTPTPVGDRGFTPGGGIAVDPTNGDILVSDPSSFVVDEFSPQGVYIGRLTGADTPVGEFTHQCRRLDEGNNASCNDLVVGVAVNSQGYVYVGDGLNGVVDIYKPRPIQPTIAYKPETNPTDTSGTLNATAAPNGGGDITSCHFDYGTTTSYSLGSKTCVPDPSGSNFSAPTDVHADISSLTAETHYHYRVVVGNANATRIGPDQIFTPHKVQGLRADPATNVTASSATLNGSFLGDGTAGQKYYFEWGKTTTYGNKSATPPGDSAGSPGVGVPAVKTFDITDLDPVTRYHYRIVAVNGSGTSSSDDQSFRTLPLAPQVKESVSDVHSNGALFHTQINPGGADTSYHFEYGTSPCSDFPNPCASTPTPDAHVGSDMKYDSGSKLFEGLDPNTVYYYRVVATNSAGTVSGPDKTFATQPFNSAQKDVCPNTLARQQTGASQLLDCRAYELVSAAHAGGYDVESNLVPSQTPFGGYPQAKDQVLYGVHNGAIPGTGNPTNHGIDPYVATRSDSGWSTSYAGIPADAPEGPLASPPFSSTPSGADSSLDTFAFGGSDLCDPCFSDGSQGIPVHNPDGSLSQGMLGSGNVANPISAGTVKKPLSDDGSHLVFGSEQQIELGGNDSSGDVTIYSRDLKSATTEVVSTDTGGTALADGDNVVELDVSENGSRVLIGDLISTDSAGNHYYDLFMHVAGNPDSIHLTPNVPDGALYDGMSADGTQVFFTTKDVPTGTSDDDTSADIFKADVGGSGATLTRISGPAGADPGDPGDTDLCNPDVGWNSVAGGANCDAVAIGGGGGVASGDGTFYFLSPELLDGPTHGTQDEPNLYVVRPPDSAPQFVAMLDTTGGQKPVVHYYSHDFGSFFAFVGLGITVDQANSDIYVLDPIFGSVSRFKPDGTPDNFTCGGCSDNTLSGFSFDYPAASQVAIDNSGPGHPHNGYIYVTNNFGGGIDVFANDGTYIGTLNGSGNAQGYFGEGCGVAVDQSNGDVYVGDYGNRVWRYTPSSAAIQESDYSGGIDTGSLFPCAVAADSGNVYAADSYSNANGAGVPLRKYKAFDFAAGSPPTAGYGEIPSAATAVATDPSNGDVYADDGDQILQFNASDNQLFTIGADQLSNSKGVAVDGSGNSSGGNVYATDGSGFSDGHVSVFPLVPQQLSNPTVIDAVSQADTRHTADFQATPDGAFAAFPSTQALLPSVDNAGHTEIYRYDASALALDCVSCNPTHAEAVGDASLASNGLSLLEDGRVFFDTTDVLALLDANNRKDVYEWETPGTGNCVASSENPNYYAFTGDCLSLISAGSSPFDSSLLSAGADGTDAYFFTHDTLAHEDENGPVAKIYDARADGGFFHVPPPALCAASDECHGPGTQAPGSPGIGTIAGTPKGNAPARCKAGYVKRRGACVRKHHRKRHRRHHKATHRHG
jgi:hypothetical protein